ncbi:MAG: sigma-70 family RNA polymerase sigma factor, partial [Nitrospinota bacterium]|nr:sigma-70 family RNA polymerase sigma factor [Nitrospinota bacterium]
VSILYSAAFRLTGTQAEAEDLLQETLLKAYKGLDLLVDERNPAGWAYTILKNTFLNRSKKNLHVPRPFNDPEYVNRIPSIDAHSGGGDELDDKLQNALEELPEDMRLILIAREVEGLSYQEIADIHRLSLGTVKSRINRGREKLREFYLKER